MEDRAVAADRDEGLGPARARERRSIDRGGPRPAAGRARGGRRREPASRRSDGFEHCQVPHPLAARGASRAASSAVNLKSRGRVVAGRARVAAARETSSACRLRAGRAGCHEALGRGPLRARRVPVQQGGHGQLVSFVVPGGRLAASGIADGGLVRRRVGRRTHQPRNSSIRPSSRPRRASRPRWIRDLTVPSETPVMSAISA